MEKNFEYYLEMAHDGHRNRINRYRLNNSIFDLMEKVIDYQLMMIEDDENSSTIKINIIEAINSYKKPDPRLFEIIDDKEKMTKIIKGVVPRYEDEGWFDITFEYPILTLHQ